jgi:pilus assembly protein CpaE
MGAPSKTVMTAKDLDAARFATLLGIVKERYRHVVVDGSHVLDDLSGTVLGMTKTVAIIVQQSVVQLKQAARLMRVLFTNHGIPDDRIAVVVNRHSKRSTVTLEDIQRTLARDSVAVVPNHYKSVLSSIDGGIPMLEFEPSSPVSRAIIDLQRTICGAPPVQRTGLLRRALPMFSGDE